MNPEQLYSIIHSPMITEKGMNNERDYNQYLFRVNKTANKIQVRQAIEQIYGVNVVGVQILVTKPKMKRNKHQRMSCIKQSWKKAYVRIADGQSIEHTRIKETI